MGMRLVILSLVLILAATLFPYSFSLPGPASGNQDSSGFWLHFLLFFPFGFSLSLFTSERNLKSVNRILVALVTTSILSILTEVLQFFLPSRSVTISDGIGNLFGAFLGYCFFDYLGAPLKRLARVVEDKLEPRLNTRFWVLVYGSYLFFAVCISLSLPKSWRLLNWDQSYPLVLGNESTGDRPWRGNIYSLKILSKTMSLEHVLSFYSTKKVPTRIKDSLLCSYELEGAAPLIDTTGQLPELTAKGKRGSVFYPSNLMAGSDYWLSSHGPSKFLIDEIRKTSEFSIITEIKTAGIKQEGPARIISSSIDQRGNRNFTLAQNTRELVVRLRTISSGGSERIFELRFPNVFTSTSEILQLILTFHQSTVTLFLNETAQIRTIKLSPEVAFFAFFTSIHPDNINGYSLLYYGMIFIPLGIILAFILQSVKQRSILVKLAMFSLVIPLSSTIIAQVRMNMWPSRMDFEGSINGIVFSSCGLFLFWILDQLGTYRKPNSSVITMPSDN